MTNNFKIISEQDRRLYAYLAIELEIIEENYRAYPLPVPKLYKTEERRIYLKNADLWSVQFELLSRIKRTIEYSMREGGYEQIIGFLEIEFEGVEESWRNLPLPVPPMYNTEEKEDYLQKRELIEVQCNLLKRILKVTKNCIVSIKKFTDEVKD